MGHETSRAEENRKFALDLIERMEKNMGMKIHDLFEGEKGHQEIRAAMHERIITWTQERLDKEEPSEAAASQRAALRPIESRRSAKVLQ